MYPKTNEVFVADGYGNRRVIVFDAEPALTSATGELTETSPTTPLPRNRVYEGRARAVQHGARNRASRNDGLVYVGDRVNNRIQVFTARGQVRQRGLHRTQDVTPEGTAFDVAFSPDKRQQFFYVPDGSNKKVQILNRGTLEVVGFFGGQADTAWESSTTFTASLLIRKATSTWAK